MRNKKTPMRRAFIEIGDENFISIEQVASDPTMRAAAIASLKREIGRLSLAEKRVAKNTLHVLRTVRDGTTKGRGPMRSLFAAIGKALDGIAFAIRWTVGGIALAIRKTLSGIVSAIHRTLSGIEFAVQKTLGGIAFAIRWTLAGIEFARCKTLNGIVFVIHCTLGGIESAIRETLGGAAFVTRKTRASVAHLFARVRRVFAPGT